MRFTAQSDPPRVPTKGHPLDHISFEIKGLPEFCKKLEAQGTKLDMQIIDAPQIGLKVIRHRSRKHPHRADRRFRRKVINPHFSQDFYCGGADGHVYCVGGRRAPRTTVG